MQVFGKYKARASGIIMLLLIAVLLKSFIPAGFMPEAGNGYMKMVICSGMGEKTVYVPVDQDNGQNEGHETATDHCPFQTLTTAKFVPAPSAAIVEQPTPTESAPVEQDAPFLTNFHTHSIAARGPPSSLI